MEVKHLYPHVAQQHVHMVAVTDVTAVGVVAATFMGWLPNIAAGMSIIYLAIQISLAIRNWWREP